MVKSFFAIKKGGLKKSTITVREHGLIGMGSEREVHEAKVVVLRNKQGKLKRGKTLKLALKRFDQVYEHDHPWSNPFVQVRNFNSLKELNTKKKLGLNIIPTYRLIEAPTRTPGIVATNLRILNWEFFKKVPEKVKKEVLDKIKEQMDIVKSEGFDIAFDAFALVKVKDDLVPYIADFRSVHPSRSQAEIEKKLAQIEAHKNGNQSRKAK
ncbi:MAG: hypothetical protein WC821_03770 [archaeon]|jgi:hypothetical protein